MENNDTNPKQNLLDKLKASKNVLVTVSSNPSVDQLAACLGLTLWLNKLDKHATAVFSGDVPSTLEFLKPEETLEKNTDSLRDFIIALDKSKADKLRYKVEDTVVKIFITPYRTSLSADDLEYSQGDFNVDMVIALGVSSQADIDAAITAHGRILHDATVTTITTGESATELGSISWHDTQASSLSELIVDLGNSLDREQLDSQIATALLTGVVAETERFSNEKTTPQTMSISAELMSAGANQQLVASKLEEPVVEPEPKLAETADQQGTDNAPSAESSNDGTLEIAHQSGEQTPDEPSTNENLELPEPEAAKDEEPEAPQNGPAITDVKETSPDNDTPTEPAPESEAAAESSNEEAESDQPSRLVTEPPLLGGTLTANSRPDDIMLEPASDPLSNAANAQDEPLLDHDAPGNTQEPTPPADDLQPAPPEWMPPQPWMNQPADATADSNIAPESEAEPEAPADTQAPATPFTPKADETLAEIERDVNSPHVTEEQPDLDSARDEVMKAIGSVPDASPEPIQALNAQSIDLNQSQDTSDAPALVDAQPMPTTVFDPAAFNIANDPESALTPPPAPAEPELTGPVEQPYTMPLPDSLAPPAANPMPPTSVGDDPLAPPPVPPPLPFTNPGPPRS